MNEPTTYRAPQSAGAVHYPAPIPTAAPLVPVQPGHIPAVLPDGRVVTGYAVTPAQPEPFALEPPVSRAAVNVALGGVGFLAACGGLLMLTTFIAALAALIQQLIILAAVVFGGFIAVQILGSSGRGGSTTVNIRKAVIKRNHFHG
ncbi:hypothetical protein [Streptomyces sp. NPDC088785]|uniref:hypothetical protein n=1 Tax=Streptomyces sp. NPDC088785 TaxID=3365897 RepID=UPI0037F415AF